MRPYFMHPSSRNARYVHMQRACMVHWGRTRPSTEYSVQDGEKSVLSKVEL
jgi:hypothetical protein